LADPDRVLDHFDDFMHHSQQDLTGTHMYFKCLVMVNVTCWKSKSVWSCIIFNGMIHGFSSCLVVINIIKVYTPQAENHWRKFMTTFLKNSMNSVKLQHKT